MQKKISILQSGMLWPSLILAVALTTARADTFSNLNSSCVVREGPCDINFRTEDGEPLTSPIGTVNTTTLQQCASHCEGNADCTAFQLSPDLGTCQMFDSAELPPHHDIPGSNSASTASEICGLCAKGPKARKIFNETGLYCFTKGDEDESKCQNSTTYESDGLYCVTTDQKLCNFPFIHADKEHYSPIAVKDDDDNEILKCKREDYRELQDCERCEDQDQRIGHHYKGFPVHNKYNMNSYKRVTNAECQKLCRETPGCFYYNYDEAVQGCWLKYGIAKKGIESDEATIWNSGDNLKFGHKYSNPLVDCEYYWSDWSPCSVDCGGGHTTREMTITKNPDDEAEKYRGIPCPAPDERFQNKSCNNVICPVHCKIHEWTEWSWCSASCGGGERTRIPKNITENPKGLGKIRFKVGNGTDHASDISRGIIKLRLYDDGIGIGMSDGMRNCSTGDIGHLKFGWQNSTELGDCRNWTTTQDLLTVYTEVESDNEDVFISGLEFYTVEDVKISEDTFDPQFMPGPHRYRINFTVRGTECQKSDESCNTVCCPVDCRFKPIKNPSCNATCGGGWKKIYEISQPPDCNGKACPGNQWEECNTDPCNCEFDWSAWSTCSADCGPGFRIRTPDIKQHRTSKGRKCPEEQKSYCNKGECTVSLVSLSAGFSGALLLCICCIIILGILACHYRRRLGKMPEDIALNKIKSRASVNYYDDNYYDSIK